VLYNCWNWQHAYVACTIFFKKKDELDCVVSCLLNHCYCYCRLAACSDLSHASHSRSHLLLTLCSRLRLHSGRKRVSETGSVGIRV